jgi:hypothetical protein
MSAQERPSVADDDEDRLPSLEEVEALYAASRNGPLPPWLTWLTPEGLAAMAEAVASGIPELNGPIDQKDLPPDDD